MTELLHWLLWVKGLTLEYDWCFKFVSGPVFNTTAAYLPCFCALPRGKDKMKIFLKIYLGHALMWRSGLHVGSWLCVTLQFFWCGKDASLGPVWLLLRLTRVTVTIGRQILLSCTSDHFSFFTSSWQLSEIVGCFCFWTISSRFAKQSCIMRQNAATKHDMKH